MEISRSLARQLRAVFRRLVDKHAALRPLLSFDANHDGLRIRLHRTQIAVEYRLPGSFSAEAFLLPLDALADFEGRIETPVRLETTVEGAIAAQWLDGAVPQSKQYVPSNTDDLTKFPDDPEQIAENGPELWKALADASECAAREPIRYSTEKLQLRGNSGEIVATDGQQLLIQGGFRFSWQEDVLIPNTTLFSSRDLAIGSAVSVGHTATHVTFKTGLWTLHFPIDTEGRYPHVDECIPNLTGVCTRCRLDPADAAFLGKTLPSLPGGDDDNAPVTVDLNGHASVRTRAQGQARTTEVVLSRSRVGGSPLRVCLNRGFLARALRLGLPEICVVKPDAPLVCQDHLRRFIVMPLAKERAITASDDAVCIHADSQEPIAPSHKKERTPSPVTTPQTNGAGTGNGHASRSPAGSPRRRNRKDTSLAGLIEEAQALKEIARDAFGRAHRLLGALKRQKRQSKIVENTLASLRQLHDISS